MGRTLRHRRKKQDLKYPPSLNHNQSVIKLVQALKLRNWDNETDLELRDFRETGRGVCSKSSIQSDAILIKVPVHSMISLCTFDKDTFNFLHADGSAQLSMPILLSLFLCVEKHKAGNSAWQFYLDSLPHCNPLTWLQLTPSEVAQFPRHVAARMEEFRALFARSWGRVLTAINATRRCSCCGEPMRRVISVDLFAWCYAMINTRGVYIDPAFVRHYAATTSPSNAIEYVLGEPDLALCPFLDMFNHSSEARTTPEIVSDGNEDFYVLRTYKFQRKYEQIFISYGAHDNAKLFVEYGFFIPANPFDAWPLRFEDVCKLVSFDERQYRYILSKGFDRELYVTASCASALSFNLKAVLFVSRHQPKDFECVYRDDYTSDEIDWFAHIVRSLMDSQLTQLTPKCFSDYMTQIFYEYLINFPIDISNVLGLRNEARDSAKKQITISANISTGK